MRFAKRVFFGAGILGVAIVTPLYSLYDYIGRHYPPPLTHPDFHYGFIGVTLAWQIAFLLIATDPVRFRPLMAAAMVEKFVYVVTMSALFATGQLQFGQFLVAGPDLVVRGEFPNCAANTPERIRRSCHRPESEAPTGLTQAISHCHTIAVNRLTQREVRNVSAVVAERSRRPRRLIQPTAVHVPAIRTERRACAARGRARVRRVPGQPRMCAVTVVVASEIRELHLQISGRPEQVRSRHSRRMVPISRSTNGCESGTYGTVLISSTSRIRRFRCHWWNRNRGSWSELT
jgi:hypothetical protein